MERLTYRLEDQYGNPTDSIILESDLIFLNSSEKWKKVLSRLAAYEDTGLEPEEIISAVDMAKVACALEALNAYKELGSLDHLRELAEADREGRCVMLPCKVGDTVYFITGTYNSLVKPAKVEEIYIGDGSIALGVSTDFTTFTLQESEWHLTREEAEAALAKGST